MKKFIITCTLIASNLMAQDMSSTESYKSAYKENSDGSVEYVGKCSTHQDYENRYFKVSKVLVEYFEPDYNNQEQDVKSKTANLESELLKAATKALQYDSLAEIDDLTVDKIKNYKFPNTDLYRMNVGVGGGNGIYLVFNRIQKNQKISYELMSYVMDGDVEFCDSLVWLK